MDQPSRPTTPRSTRRKVGLGLLRVLWGLVVLVALFCGAAALIKAVGGELDQAALLLIAAALLFAVAFGLERATERDWYALPRAERSERAYSFRVVSRRLGRVALAALVVGGVGIAANQVRVIVEDGVADWLTADATTVGELIAVTVLLLLFLALLMWPLFILGDRILDRVTEIRLKRSIRESNRLER